VLVVNRAVADPADVGGRGASRSVHLRVDGGDGEFSVRTLDAETPLASGPATRPLAEGSRATVTLAGYGVAIVTLRPYGSR